MRTENQERERKKRMKSNGVKKQRRESVKGCQFAMAATVVMIKQPSLVYDAVLMGPPQLHIGPGLR